MARQYRITPLRRLINRAMTALIRLGLAPKSTYLLTVRGRRTGKPYSTPVTLVEESGDRWLVAPYGEVGWVRNARASGRVRLTRNRRSEDVSITELDPEKAAPILKKYVGQIGIVRPYFDARPESSIEAFKAEARRHPVFQIHRRAGF